jgi:PleD family two-component response regulator
VGPASVAAAPLETRSADLWLDDRKFRLQVAADFAAAGPKTLAEIQALWQCLTRATVAEEKTIALDEMARKTHALAGSASMAEARMVARLASALEALIGEARSKPENITPSSTRTMAQAIDFLAKLVQDLRPAEIESDLTPLVLVVDDEPVSRQAVVWAMTKGRLSTVQVDNSDTALLLLRDNSFELALLDIDMPGLSGLELCKRMRAMEKHKSTPVIFVTGQGDFMSRAQSAVSGGNDFIAKPFMFIELAVKALVHVSRGRLEKARSSKSAA